MENRSNDDTWDFYSCSIDDLPHSTFVNLSLTERAPIADLPIFKAIEVTLLQPNPDTQMSTNAEFDRLSEMEDFIQTFDSEELVFIGRQTGAGKRKFYFYAASSHDMTSVIDAFSKAFPEYHQTSFQFEDPKWQTYQNDLYPNDIAFNEIGNRHVVFQLAEYGDDGQTPRTIDHNIIFTDKSASKEFEGITAAMGFEVTSKRRGLFNHTYDVLLQKTDSPVALDPITMDLKNRAEQLGGEYDGWGCTTVTSAPES
jgi:regulator of RNase E activity RraB